MKALVTVEVLDKNLEWRELENPVTNERVLELVREAGEREQPIRIQWSWNHAWGEYEL